MIVIYSWTATVILNGMAEPFALAKNLFIEQTNEFIIMILIYHMLCFADLVTEEQTRSNIGWSMIAIMCGTIVFNFSIILFDSIGVFYKKVRLWYYSRKNLRLKIRIKKWEDKQQLIKQEYRLGIDNPNLDEN